MCTLRFCFGKSAAGYCSGKKHLHRTSKKAFYQLWAKVRLISIFWIANNIVLNLHAKFDAPLTFPLLVKYLQRTNCQWSESITWKVRCGQLWSHTIYTAGLSLHWRVELCDNFMYRDTLEDYEYYAVRNKALIYRPEKLLLLDLENILVRVHKFLSYVVIISITKSPKTSTKSYSYQWKSNSSVIVSSSANNFSLMW